MDKKEKLQKLVLNVWSKRQFLKLEVEFFSTKLPLELLPMRNESLRLPAYEKRSGLFNILISSVNSTAYVLPRLIICPIGLELYL